MPFTRLDVLRVMRLAVPVAIAELGWMAMTTVDTIMVGPLGPEAIGALGLSNSAFYSIAIFGMGLLLGLDTLVSQAHGAGDKADAHRSLAQGVYAAFFISIPLTVIFLFLPEIFGIIGINSRVGHLAALFVKTLTWSTLPLLLYGAFRRYLQGTGHVRPVMFVLVSANVVNWLFNWLLIEGHAGFPALGVTGSALSTCFARVYMVACLVCFVWYFERGQKPGWRGIVQPPNFVRLKRLFQLGLPAATQIMLEIGAFGAAALLAGRLNTISLAAHQIVLNCASVSYMVPLGIASASAVAVGQAMGSGSSPMARLHGYIGILLACSFMACSAAVFFFFPRQLMDLYTHDEPVIKLGSGLLAIAALFQLFDGVQTVATGALRGLGETRMPMLVNLGGYWVLGLPIGYWLCFHWHFGIAGLWWGLTLALILIALVLLLEWQRKIAALIQSA